MLSVIVIKTPDIDNNMNVYTPAIAHSSAYSKEIGDIIFDALMSGITFAKVVKVDSIEKLDKYDFEIWRGVAETADDVILVDRFITLEET